MLEKSGGAGFVRSIRFTKEDQQRHAGGKDGIFADQVRLVAGRDVIQGQPVKEKDNQRKYNQKFFLRRHTLIIPRKENPLSLVDKLPILLENRQ